MMSIVFLAGPLSGLIVQPLVGVLSDRCKSNLGRRRPFIIAGCACSSLSVLMLGWSKEIAGFFAEDGSTVHNHLAIACAVLSVYLIDFSVNVIQAMDRSLLVDVVSPAHQPAANAWAGRMFGFGAVFGYWIGGLDLVWWTRGWLGGEQLKVLTIFTSVLLMATHAVSVSCVRERILISREDDHLDGGGGAMRAIEDIWTTIRTLPRPIQQVFNVQFTGWIGWFPVLFFSTTWVAEIYVKSRSGSGAELASAPDDIRDAATRAGTRAMLWHSVVSLATSIIIPPLVAPNNPSSHDRSSSSYRYSTSLSAFDRVKRFLPHLPFTWLSLPLLWAISNIVFSLLLFGTYFATSVSSATFILATTGFAWGVTNWAPFAILGDLILRMGSSPLGLSPNNSTPMLTRTGAQSSSHLPPRSSTESWDDDDGGSQRMLSTIGEESPASSRPGYASPAKRRVRSPALTGFELGGSPTSAGSLSSRGGSPALAEAYTPTTARSFYFDAASAAGSSSAGGDASGAMSRSTSGHSFASISSGGSNTPTLTASPVAHGGEDGGRSRQNSAASSTIAYPPNHGSVGVALFGAAGGARSAAEAAVAFGADPYAFADRAGADASSSTIHLPPRGGVAAFSATPRAPVPPPPPLYLPSEAGSDDGATGAGGDSHVLQIRHSDSFDFSDDERPHLGVPLGHLGGGGGGEGPERRGSTATIMPAREGAPRILVGEEDDSPEEWDAQDTGAEGGAGGAQPSGGGDQTGVILGCHNIYLVLPQFLVTGLSSIIFALFAPQHTVLGHQPVVHHPPALGNGTTASIDALDSLAEADDGRERGLAVRVVRAVGGAVGQAFAAKVRRQADGGEELPPGGEAGWDALGLIFRVGGVAAACSAYICFRMWRERLAAERRARSAQRGYRLTG
ncbi:hypothetical protein JCM10449v2_003165 [Rhodotorula kratochvilovae]